MAPTQDPLHAEILLTPPCANPQIAESPELSLLHTTILATPQAAGTGGTTEIAILVSLKSLLLPSTPHAREAPTGASLTAVPCAARIALGAAGVRRAGQVAAAVPRPRDARSMLLHGAPGAGNPALWWRSHTNSLLSMTLSAV